MSNSTAMDEVASGVPDNQVSTPDEDKARRLATMLRARDELVRINERLQMIERAMAKDLPEVLKEQPMGDAIDLISDIHIAFRDIDGENGSLGAVKKRIDYSKEVTMPARMDEEKVKTFNTDRFRVTRLSKVFASITGGQAAQGPAFEWLRDNELGDLIKPTVNASSLSAVAKNLIENGKELPDDLFSVAFKDSISVTVKK
jgi:hypothetical protein